MKTLFTFSLICLLSFANAQSSGKNFKTIAGNSHPKAKFKFDPNQFTTISNSPSRPEITKTNYNKPAPTWEDFVLVKSEQEYPMEGDISMKETELSAVNSYGWTTLQYPDFENPAPIAISHFTGSENGSESIIKWDAVAAAGTSYFTIERQINDIEYRVVGIVKASFDNSGIIEYSFIDKTPEQNAMNYYRIIRHDNSGMTETFGPVSIRIGNPQNSVSWPNPFINNMSVIIPEEALGGKITISNILGKSVFEQNIMGNNMVLDLNTEAWPSGNYFITISGLSYNKTTRIMKL